MKKFRIFWTDFTLKCLGEIKEYIVHEAYSENTAERYIKRLIENVELL